MYFGSEIHPNSNGMMGAVLQSCVWAGLTWVMTSTEFWLTFGPVLSRLNLSIGMDWLVWGTTLTKITFSSVPTIPQHFATFTAVRMLSPVWRQRKQFTVRLMDFGNNKKEVECNHRCEIPLTCDHDASDVCQSQGVDSCGTLWLHEILQNQKTQKLHVFLDLSSVTGTRIHQHSLMRSCKI